MPINASFSYFDRCSAPQKQAEQCSIMTSKLASAPVSLLHDEQERFQPKRLDFRRWVRRSELRQIVPLGDTTIYKLKQKGEFPRRFNPPNLIVLLDDVLTTGCSFMVCRDMLQEALPNANIIGIFAAHRVVDRTSAWEDFADLDI